ncbi:MAG: hypothetical protein WAK53_08685 [Chromatiaceae bacterium]|jgi:hypothetical protein
MRRITLERFRTERQQKVAAAKAEHRAAEEQATRQRLLAEDPRPTGP